MKLRDGGIPINPGLAGADEPGATVRYEDGDLRRPVVVENRQGVPADPPRVVIPRRVGQVNLQLDCEDCGRSLTLIILIDRPLNQPLVWNGVACTCGATQTIDLTSEKGATR